VRHLAWSIIPEQRPIEDNDLAILSDRGDGLRSGLRTQHVGLAPCTRPTKVVARASVIASRSLLGGKMIRLFVKGPLALGEVAIAAGPNISVW
jgi:hypothetical protein